MTARTDSLLEPGPVRRLGFVDLSERRVSTIDVADDLARRFLGGRGLGAALLLEHGRDVGPLDAESIFCLLTGPLTASGFPLSNRLCFVFRSPATGTLAWANTGGHAAVALRNMGFDGIVLTGRSDSPCMLVVADGSIAIEDASMLWGAGAVTATELLLDRYRGARVLAIGPAGETCSPVATIINDKGRASGVRHGVGAVWGSKQLKAIIIKDSQSASRRPSDAAAYKPVLARVHRKIRESPVLSPKHGTMAVHGTAIAVEAMGLDQAMPVRNYTSTVLPDYLGLGGRRMTEEVLVERITCSFCPVQCRRETGSTGKFDFQSEGPDYAQLVSFGSNCSVVNVRAVSYLNYLSYELGLDPIEMGNALAMLADATERGVVDAGLAWGDVDRMIDLVRDTAAGRGLGAHLWHGVTGAAARLGAPDLAMSVKGISLQNCDPRAEPAWGLLNATETYGGAAHIWCYGDLVHAMRHIGVRPLVTPDSSPRQIAEAVKYKQDLVAALDSISICAFSSYAYDERDYCDALELIAGIEMTPDDFLARGNDVIQLERRFNLLHGLRPEEDRLPERFLREPIPEGLHAGRRCDLEPMLDEYYALRQWDRDASPADDRAVARIR